MTTVTAEDTLTVYAGRRHHNLKPADLQHTRVNAGAAVISCPGECGSHRVPA